MARLQTPHFGSIPPHAHHAITVHLPGWQYMLRAFVDRDPEIWRKVTSMYPRIVFHRDIKALTEIVLTKYGTEGQNLILFSAPPYASACKEFATSSARGDDVLSPDEVVVRLLGINVRLYAVFFPRAKMSGVMPFWINAGVGISSRLAEESLKHLDLLQELPVEEEEPAPKAELSPADLVLRERIAGLMERAPRERRERRVRSEDVYLFATGMAAIYSVHQFLLSMHNAKTVLFGFAFHSTPHVFEDFGPGYKFFGLGDAEELLGLEEYLKDERGGDRKVQAVWTEFPANPLLATPDLGRLRELADEYGFLLIVDDTVGSFCNVDLLGAADIVVTSLTKSFSGYADVMAASAVLNPSSSRYAELKELLTMKYENTFWSGDAETLEKNSRDYLSRSAILNKNAETLVAYLHAQASNPASHVAKVYYPTTSPTLSSYQARMRQPSAEFTPGYGCLFSLELDTVEATKDFYDHLDVHQGPHLGAHLTLAMPYAKALYAKELEWAGRFGLRETQIRVSVGLEDTEALLGTFREALEAAGKVEEDEGVASA
ncbi:hypothetical protein PZA11_006746 [Diplocarpon coronariae]